VTREFVNAIARPRHGQLALPRERERGRVVDLELIEQRRGIEQAEALDQVQMAVPSKIAAGIAVVASLIGEVRRIDDQRLPFPTADLIAQ
jgi:hypothetical protein